MILDLDLIVPIIVSILSLGFLLGFDSFKALTKIRLSNFQNWTPTVAKIIDLDNDSNNDLIEAGFIAKRDHKISGRLIYDLKNELSKELK